MQNKAAQSNTIQKFCRVITYCYLPLLCLSTKEENETSRCRHSFGCCASGFFNMSSTFVLLKLFSSGSFPVSGVLTHGFLMDFKPLASAKLMNSRLFNYYQSFSCEKTRRSLVHSPKTLVVIFQEKLISVFFFIMPPFLVPSCLLPYTLKELKILALPLFQPMNWEWKIHE